MKSLNSTSYPEYNVRPKVDHSFGRLNDQIRMLTAITSGGDNEPILSIGESRIGGTGFANQSRSLSVESNHTYAEDLRKLMRHSPLFGVINHNYNKRKLNSTLLPSDRNETLYQAILGQMDQVERDLIPPGQRLGDSEDFENLVFLKLTQDQISTVLLNGVLDNIIHRKDQNGVT
jgi:hypothetical protein